MAGRMTTRPGLMENAHVININNTREEIELREGRYNIDILGGWGVRLRQFAISLTHVDTGQNVECKRSLWPVQTFAFGKKTKRIFTIDVATSGVYRAKFGNVESLEVKDSGLFFSGLFQDAIPNEEISIYIHS